MGAAIAARQDGTVRWFDSEHFQTRFALFQDPGTSGECSTRANTFGIVSSIREQGLDIAPHLSFGGDDTDTIGELLERYVDLGIAIA